MFYGIIRGVPMDKAEERYMDAASYRARGLLQEKIDYCPGKKVLANYEVAIGHAGEKILEFARKNNITLIIIGSKGHRDMAKIKALGSVSRHVVENSSCPVMIVH